MQLNFKNISNSKSHIRNELESKSILSLRDIAINTKDPQLKENIRQFYTTKSLINGCRYNIKNFEPNPDIRRHMIGPVKKSEYDKALSDKPQLKNKLDVLANKITGDLLKEKIRKYTKRSNHNI